MRIDMHAHIIPQCVYKTTESHGHWYGHRIEQNAKGQDVVLAKDHDPRVTPPSMRFTPDERAEAMEGEGVDMHLLSLDPHLLDYSLGPKDSLKAAQEVNDDISAFVHGRPDRFRGLATLPMQDPNASVEELERAMKELGLTGIELCASIGDKNFDDPSFHPVWKAAERLGAIIFVHATPDAPLATKTLPFLYNLIGNPLETTLAIYSVIFGGVLDHFPNLKFCFGHGGGLACFALARVEEHGYKRRPQVRERAKLPPSEYMRRMHFDCIVHTPANMRFLMDHVGSDRVVLGSDFPFDPCYRDAVGWVQGLDIISEEEKEKVLSSNAMQLLGL